MNSPSHLKSSGIIWKIMIELISSHKKTFSLTPKKRLTLPTETNQSSSKWIWMSTLDASFNYSQAGVYLSFLSGNVSFFNVSCFANIKKKEEKWKLFSTFNEDRKERATQIFRQRQLICIFSPSQTERDRVKAGGEGRVKKKFLWLFSGMRIAHIKSKTLVRLCQARITKWSYKILMK